MKSAADWAHEMSAPGIDIARWVRAIQADALRHAADRAHNAADWSHWKLMSDLRDAIRAEAAALEKEKK